MEAALRKGVLALQEAIGRLYLVETRPAEAVKLLVEPFARAKQVEGSVEEPSTPPNAAVAQQLTDACGRLSAGDAAAAVDLAKAALAAARNAGDKASEVPALKVLAAAHAANRDIDGAVKAAKEVVKAARKGGDNKAQVFALAWLSAALLASQEPGQAAATAEEAATVARGPAAGEAGALAAALGAQAAVHMALGRPASALKAAREVHDAVKGQKRSEAAALLSVADAFPGSRDGLAAAKEAVAAFQDLGDKAGEGAALIALAFAHGDQADRQFDESLTAARSAAEIFKAAGDAGGEALALSTASRASALKEDTQEASRLAKEALAAFKRLGLKVGEQYAADLVSDAPFSWMQQTGARLLFDQDKLAHIEVSELATQDSLESIVSTLHHYHCMEKFKYIKGVIVHVEGTVAPSRLHAYAISTGTFLIGVRTLGVPVVSCCNGTISGPSWGLALIGDYRIAAADTQFCLPILRPMECLPQLLGPSTATHLTMNHGTLSAASALEMGIFHQVQKDKEWASRSAKEQSKRISNFPVLASRQTLTLMMPDAEKYVFIQ